MADKRFPLQGGLTISWAAAERAHAAYSKLYGSSQSLERIAERGGFGVLEFVAFYTYPRLPAPHLGLTETLTDGKLERALQQALAESDVRSGAVIVRTKPVEPPNRELREDEQPKRVKKVGAPFKVGDRVFCTFNEALGEVGVVKVLDYRSEWYVRVEMEDEARRPAFDGFLPVTLFKKVPTPENS